MWFSFFSRPLLNKVHSLKLLLKKNQFYALVKTHVILNVEVQWCAIVIKIIRRMRY